MKQLNSLFHSKALAQVHKGFLAGLVAFALAALCTSGLFSRAHADDGLGGNRGNGEPLAQEAQILALLSDYHGALANGGNIAAMGSLWVENGSLTLNNGAPFIGKEAVLSFFATGPYFSHNWVSLAPEWKTTISVHGNTAEATTECIATDVSVTPNVVRGVIQVNATCQKVGDSWLFTHMNNFTLTQL